MKFYLKYILLGVVIGLLSLAGCEDTDATPYDEHDVEMKLRILAVEARLQQFDSVAEVVKSNQVLVNTLTDIEANQSKKQYLCDDIDPNAPINTHLLKVSESWAKEYGTSQESVLKYNVVAAWAFAQKALEQIAELEKRLAAIEPVDPNEVKE